MDETWQDQSYLGQHLEVDRIFLDLFENISYRNISNT